MADANKANINDHLDGKKGAKASGPATPGRPTGGGKVIRHESEEAALAAYEEAVEVGTGGFVASTTKVSRNLIEAEEKRREDKRRRAAMPKYEGGPPPGEPLLECGLPQAIQYRVHCAAFLKQYDAMSQINSMEPVTEEEKEKYRMYLTEVGSPALQITSYRIFALAYRMAYARDVNGVNRFRLRPDRKLDINTLNI